MSPDIFWQAVCLPFLLLLLPAHGSLPACDPNSQEIKNRTESVGSDKLYYNCDYPNPRTSPAACGRQSASMICDPSRVLTASQADELNNLLEAFYKDTPCDCGACDANPHGSPLWIAVVKRMAITDMSGALCVHGSCKDVFPKVNPSGREPKDSELDSSIEDFGDQLLSRWHRDSDCRTDVVIVYDTTYKRMYIAYNNQPKHKYLTEANVQAVISAARSEWESGNIVGGLSSSITGVQAKYTTGPSQQFIIIVTLSVVFGTVALIAIVAAFIYCYRQGQQSGGGCCAGCRSYWAEKGGIYSWDVFCCDVKEETGAART